MKEFIIKSDLFTDNIPSGTLPPCMGIEIGDGVACAVSSLAGDSLTPYMRRQLYPDAGRGGDFITFSVGEDGSLTELARLRELGNLRQLRLSGRYAYVTAREDGLYIIDIGDPSHPRVARRWDTVEFATGIAVCGKVAAIGCRNYGVELIDISCPALPRHLCSFSAGEVQSVFIDGGYLYTGSWGERECNIFDIRNAMQPKQVGKIALDGRGDGLYVSNGLLYLAIGQSSRAMKKTAYDDPGFGYGNGLEIYDVSDPSAPVLLSRTKFDRLHFTYYDMWDVKVSFPYAYVSINYLGLFVLDISDPRSPLVLERYHISLPAECRYFSDVLGDKDFNRTVVFPFDHISDPRGPVCGIAVTEGCAYLAGCLSGLHILRSELFHRPEKSERAGESVCDYYDTNPGSGLEDVRIIRTPGQARAAAWDGNVLYTACGYAGIVIYDEVGEYLGHIPTAGRVMDIKLHNGYIFTAEDSNGLVIRRLSDFAQIGRFDNFGNSIQQVILPENNRFALMHSGCDSVVIADISDLSEPREVYRESNKPGLVYGRQASLGCVGGRYCSFSWNSNMTYWYDLGGGQPEKQPWVQHGVSTAFGICPYDDERALLTTRMGYTIFNIRDSFTLPIEDTAQLEGGGMGKPALFGKLLFVTNRSRHRADVYDISDIRHPVTLKRMILAGDPDCAVYNGRTAAIPAGYQGIALFEI